jgi:hypothetical protein
MPMRKIVFLFIFLAFMFLVLLNWPFVVAEFIQPVSLVIWLLLRTFVLSVDQQYYWYALVLAAAFLLIRLIPRPISPEETGKINSFNETLRSIHHWRTMYVPDENSTYHDQFLEREYIHLLVTMYAARLHVTPDYHLHEQLREGSIPIPENIRAYLFTEDKMPERRTLKTMIRSIWNAPQKWREQSSRQKKADHDRRIEEILTFFETTLEIIHDDR